MLAESIQEQRILRPEQSVALGSILPSKIRRLPWDDDAPVEALRLSTSDKSGAHPPVGAATVAAASPRDWDAATPPARCARVVAPCASAAASPLGAEP